MARDGFLRISSAACLEFSTCGSFIRPSIYPAPFFCPWSFSRSHRLPAAEPSHVVVLGKEISLRMREREARPLAPLRARSNFRPSANRARRSALGHFSSLSLGLDF